MKSKLYTAWYIAWSTLTALPLPGPARFENSDHLHGLAARFFPLVGALIGLLIWLLAWLFNSANIPAIISAPLLLVIYYLITGFIHFDGLCDVCDAFLAQRDKATRLSILKDSRIGAYALGCGTLYLILKTALIYQLLQTPGSPVILLSMVVSSRMAMVIMAFTGHYPRSAGTGKPFIGKLAAMDVVWAAAIFSAILIVTIFMGTSPIICLVQIVTIATFCGAVWGWANHKIGGVTGDVLGATGEAVDIAILSVSLTLLSNLL